MHLLEGWLAIVQFTPDVTGFCLLTPPHMSLLPYLVASSCFCKQPCTRGFLVFFFPPLVMTQFAAICLLLIR